MRVVTVDCSGITSPDELWQRYLDAATPELGHLFGRNLDAFWDAVEGGGPGWPGEVELVFLNSSELAPLRNRRGDRGFLECLKEIANSATSVQIRFA